MNWEMAASGAEIIGAIAVVISVVYLAIQVREQTRESMQAAITSAIDAFSDYEKLVATDASLASVLIRGEGSGKSLSPVEERRFDSLMSIEFAIYERWFTDSRRTGLGQEHNELMASMLKLRLVEPGVSDWWSNNHEWFPESYVNWVDAQMK